MCGWYRAHCDGKYLHYILRGDLAAVLRASGPDFDVDAFVANCDWNVTKIFRRGEPLRPTKQLDGGQRETSGLNVTVSEAGFDDFAMQTRDAIKFLTQHEPEVRRLVAFPGVTDVVLDFGIAWRDAAAQTDEFSAELVRAAGICGIALALSHYHVSNDQLNVW